MLRLWFGFSDTVDRATYFRWGIALMAVKYIIDGALVLAFTGSWWPPLQYLSPLTKCAPGGFTASMPERCWRSVP